MARLQVLVLPAERVDDGERTPFALVLDGVSPDELAMLVGSPVDTTATGARATLVFAFPVEVL